MNVFLQSSLILISLTFNFVKKISFLPKIHISVFLTNLVELFDGKYGAD